MRSALAGLCFYLLACGSKTDKAPPTTVEPTGSAAPTGSARPPSPPADAEALSPAAAMSVGVCNATAPCPCKPGSEESSGTWFYGCQLATAVEIKGIKCAPGKVGFAKDKFLLSCVAAAPFELPGTPEGTPPEERIQCAAASVHYIEDGSIEGCILERDLTFGKKKNLVPKGAMISVKEHTTTLVFAKFGGKFYDYASGEAVLP